MCGLPDSETRHRRAAALYEVETGFREEGWPSEEFVYDGKNDLYRFADGEFAFFQRVRQQAAAAGDRHHRVDQKSGVLRNCGLALMR